MTYCQIEHISHFKQSFMNIICHHISNYRFPKWDLLRLGVGGILHFQYLFMAASPPCPGDQGLS